MEHRHSHDYRPIGLRVLPSKARGYEGTDYYEIEFKNMNNKQRIIVEVSPQNGNYSMNGWHDLITVYEQAGGDTVWTMASQMINRRTGKPSTWSLKYNKKGKAQLNADSQIKFAGIVKEVVVEKEESDGMFDWNEKTIKEVIVRLDNDC